MTTNERLIELCKHVEKLCHVLKLSPTVSQLCDIQLAIREVRGDIEAEITKAKEKAEASMRQYEAVEARMDGL